MAIKRQSVIDDIKTALTGITTGNGYYITVTNVYEYPTKPIENNERPCLVIRDTTNQVVNEMHGNPNQLDKQLSITIECYTAYNASTPTNIRKMITDVEKALGQVSKTNLNWIDLESDTIKMVQDEYIIGNAEINIKVFYRTSKFLES